jgi:hypothetical protein
MAFHLKSVQPLGFGMMLLASETDCQLPTRPSIPVLLGPVTVLLWSNPMHPAAAIDTAATHARM